MARHLPIPDLPLREIIKHMCMSPEAWAKLVHGPAKKLNVDEWQAVEMEAHPLAPRLPDPKPDTEGEREREGWSKAPTPTIFGI